MNTDIIKKSYAQIWWLKCNAYATGNILALFFGLIYVNFLQNLILTFLSPPRMYIDPHSWMTSNTSGTGAEYAEINMQGERRSLKQAFAWEYELKTLDFFSLEVRNPK